MSVEYISSKNISFRHGFFMRSGGVSDSPLDSLNVTVRVGDTRENVIENRRRALAALNLDPANLAFVDELDHADRIIAVTEAARGMDFDGYDAIMTDRAGVVIGLSVADCAAIILVSESDGVAAVVHSGWRGTHSYIVAKVVEAMREEYGVEPANIQAVIGPSVSVKTYEVSSDIAEKFNDRYVESREGKMYLNLKLAIEDQLTESGVKAIEIIPIDTIEDERFFSYRRENGNTGRFLAIASL